MENLVLVAVIATLIAALAYFLLKRLPLDIGEIRTWGLYAILGIYIVYMVVMVVIPLIKMLFAAV